MNYFTENVHGTVIDSNPAPKFITSEGDGFVSDDRQYIFVQDTVEYIHDLIFGIKGEQYAKLVRGGLVPDYLVGFKKAASMFKKMYFSFANN